MIKKMAKNNKNYSKKIEQNKGIAILFSVIVAVLMVAIGATITSIAMRQTILSSTGRESQYAFYAANTGLECARYWDWIGRLDENDGVAFPLEEASDNTIEQTRTNREDLNCAGNSIVTGLVNDDITLDVDDFSGGWNTDTANITTFNILLNPDNDGTYDYCAQVTVSKIELSEDSSNNTVGTLITSKGYNTCDKSSPRTVERGLEMYYEY